MANKPQVGTMQGRLLPPFEGRFQAFPADGWEEEMRRAAAAGIDCIEWICEVPHEADNPMGSDTGQDRLRALMAETGVGIWSICADQYMDMHLVDAQGRPQREALDHLRWLVGRAGRFGIRYMVLPFVDRSSLTPAGVEGLPAALATVLPAARDAGVELHLETDLAPAPFLALLRSINDPLVKANHDIGNSAALGFDPVEEIGLLGPHIGSVHIKDRVRGGGTVPLGTGNADLPLSLRLLRQAGFGRWYIMQIARGPLGDEPAWIAANRHKVDMLLADAAR